VHETITLRVSVLVGGDLAGKDVAKGTESVVEGLVVNVLLEVFDENVSNPRLSDAWISL